MAGRDAACGAAHSSNARGKRRSELATMKSQKMLERMRASTAWLYLARPPAGNGGPRRAEIQARCPVTCPSFPAPASSWLAGVLTR